MANFKRKSQNDSDSAFYIPPIRIGRRPPGAPAPVFTPQAPRVKKLTIFDTHKLLKDSELGMRAWMRMVDFRIAERNEKLGIKEKPVAEIRKRPVARGVVGKKKRAARRAKMKPVEFAPFELPDLFSKPIKAEKPVVDDADDPFMDLGYVRKAK